MITFRGISVVSVNRLFDLTVLHKGFRIPVAVYAVEEPGEQYYHFCTCFENTRFDRSLRISKNAEGLWFDMMDRDDLLAQAIGEAIDEVGCQLAVVGC